VLPVALVAVATGAAAQQLDFSRVSRSGDELLSYRWRDAERQEREVSFTLTRSAIKQAETSFHEYSLDTMWRVVERDVYDEVRRFGDGARIDLRRTPEGLSWTLEARDPGALERLTRRVEERVVKSKRDYLARNLRRMVGDRRIVVDFAAATRAQQGPLQAVARALENMPDVANDDRAQVALALGFFQEIPYVALEDKQRQGSDFLLASALLAQNRGDCDSKAVALAATLRSFTHLHRLAVVTMPDHALLGVEMPARPGDTTIRDGEHAYVALEVAGPAILPVGHVGPISARYLAGSARETEIWSLE
jgi:hypothetical protein